jgi:hypothetical protein
MRQSVQPRRFVKRLEPALAWKSRQCKQGKEERQEKTNEISSKSILK